MDNPPSPSTTSSAPHSVPETGCRRTLRWMGYLGLLVLGAFLCDLYHVRHILWGAVTGASGEVVWNGFCGMKGSVGHIAGFSIALLGTLLLAGITFLAFLLQFLWAFKRSWRGVAATLVLILFGLYLYGGPGLLRPDHLRENRGWPFVVGSFVRFDNALSAFFPSRPSYSEIAPDGASADTPATHEAASGQRRQDAPPAGGACSNAACPAFLPGGICSGFFAGPHLLPCRTPAWTGATLAEVLWCDDLPIPPVMQERDGAVGSCSGNLPGAGALPTKPDAPPPPLPGIFTVFKYYFFHLLCYAYSIALVSTFFARRLANAALMMASALFDAWILEPVFRRKRPIRVFWGDGDEAFAAATQNQAPGVRAVFIVPDKVPFALRHKPDSVTDRLNTHDSLRWTYASPADPGIPMSWFLARASEHFFLGADGRKNVIHANELLEFLRKYHSRFRHRFACPSPVIHVRIDAESEEDPFFRWADRWNRYSARSRDARCWNPAIQVVREPTLVAAKLLWEHPMHDVPGVSRSRPGAPTGGINLLLVGYGAQGKALLRDMVQDAQLPGVSLNVTVVDRDGRSFTELKAAAPDAIAAYNIDCRAINAFSKQFWNLLPKHGPVAPLAPSSSPPVWNRIVLAMENDLDNIRLALRIEEHYRRWNLFDELKSDGPRVIFARVRDTGNKEYIDALKTGDGQPSDAPLLPVSTFGNLEGIYGSQSFPDSSTENAAKFLNWIYLDNNPAGYPLSTIPPGAETAWRNATSFDRESSRAAVFGLRNLAWLLGYVPSTRWQPGAAAARATPSLGEAVAALWGCPDLERTLAEAEHLRWNAFHRFRGIRKWEYTPDELKAEARRIADRILAAGKQPDKNDGVKENQIRARRRHAALAPFKDLVPIGADFDEANREANLPRRSRIARADHDFVQWMPLILAKTDWTFHGEP